MKIRTILASAFAVFSALVPAAAIVSAQGVVVPIVCDVRPCRPRPMPVPLPNVLPVKSIKLDTRIAGQVATTYVEQVFRNDTPHTLEGTYFFPIPDDAAIVEFAIWENGKKLAGEVRGRDEARRIYDEIVRRQRDPGLLEYAGKGLFQASIFPIPPNSDKKLELRYSQPLKAESGTVAYRYPLGTGRNLWRQPFVQEGDIRRSLPPQRFGSVAGRIEIESRQAPRNLYSPTHRIDVKEIAPNKTLISFETTDNDSDFQLFYSLSPEDFALSLITYREAGKDGYFLLNLSPSDSLAEREIVNKDIVFVLDTSGSMADEGKMDKARAALLFGIRTLRDGDRFNVISFAGEEHLMEPGLILADPVGKRRGEEFVRKLQPTGGTNINDALLTSLKQFENGSRPRMLVFMTDGLPTVGETDVNKIISNLQKAKTRELRIFPFGFGYDVNTMLLDRLGSENAGVSDYVQPKEDLEVKVSNFFTRVSSPVLSGLDIDFGGLEVEYLYPRRLTDLFRGMQVTLIGRYRNEADLSGAVVTMKGKSGQESRSFAFRDLNFPLRDEENSFLPRLWASRRVGWLIEQIRLNGETKELKDEIVELGTRYGIVTPYTSYLATDGSFVSAGRDQASLLRVAPQAKMAISDQSGARAVRQSVQQNAMQANTTIAAEAKSGAEQVLVRNTATNQFVGNKNFFQQGTAWVDAEFAAERKLPEVNVKFASDEYFELVWREPGLAQYLSLGDEAIIVWSGKVYRVTK